MSNENDERPPGETPGDDFTRTSHGEPGSGAAAPGFSKSGRMPASIGPYRILGVLGEGGMGIVYEAEQAAPRRRVAVKVVSGGQFIDASRVRMFQREAETLARLKHPGIGAIYESGCTEDGQHFFAMELVQGRHLGDWLADRRDPPDGAELKLRLRLFRKVCEAVQYAHQRGVIHRDLKPSNIVVGEPPAPSASGSTSGESSLPEVKILDFGLARITDADVHAGTILTEVGMIKGTLPYMSPEQARGKTDEIDVRTDVYALGVILYELLAGRRPYDTANSALVEAVRVICEQPPQPLSESWRGAQRLDRDVETIVGKALEKEPARRYSSAAAFSEDIDRYLDSQPILAHPPSAAYQMRKFAQRNRAFVVGVAAVLASLLLGLATTAWGLRRARTEAALANQIAGFMQEMLDGAGPDVAQGSDATLLRGILDRTGERIETELAGQPKVEIALRDTIGQTYGAIGDYDQSATHLSAAYALSRETFGEHGAETLDAMRQLGILRTRQGRIAEAEELFRKVLEVYERRGTANDHTAIGTRHSLGELYLSSGREAEAIGLLEGCVEARKRLLGPEENLTYESMTALGLALLRMQRLPESETYLREVLDGRRRKFGATHPRTIEALYNLAGHYRESGRFVEAEALFLEALEQMEAVHGARHPKTIVARSVVGGAYLAAQRLDEAERHLTRSLDEAREVLGADHPESLGGLQRLARLRAFQGRLDEAEALLAEAMERMRRVAGSHDSLSLGTTLTMLQLLVRQRRFDEAEPLGVQLVEASRDRLGDEHPTTLLNLNELGHLYAAMKRFDDGERAYDEALDGRRRVLGEDHPDTLVSLNSLAVLYMRAGEFAKAVPQLELTLERQRARIGPDNPNSVITEYNLAHAHANLGESDKAEELFLDCVERFARGVGPDHAYTKAARKALADLYDQQGRTDEAARWRASSP